jgi:hypothetical protein
MPFGVDVETDDGSLLHVIRFVSTQERLGCRIVAKESISEHQVWVLLFFKMIPLQQKSRWLCLWSSS